ncbi:hypothetical protein [Planctomycetes bacterium TBK1r]|uniref:Uncharacterized protein n=1 Tax=Stieleria magnilauensis TaxID=2527963 RepID=A0ABX5XLN4_9BACT|nr:hypothetical protein TBK1r_18300 [Planctomycetes bacterium TBK1r]
MYQEQHLEQCWHFSVREQHGLDRSGQPFQIGLPVVDGTSVDGSVVLVDQFDEIVPAQLNVLSTWPSGSPRWVLISAVADVPAGAIRWFRVIRLNSLSSAVPAALPINFAAKPNQLFQIRGDGVCGLPGLQADLCVHCDGGQLMVADCRSLRTVFHGSRMRQWVLEGTIGGRRRLAYILRLTEFRGVGTLRCELTLHNPRRAEHAGGFWDLGDPQSELLDSVTVSIRAGVGAHQRIDWKDHFDGAWNTLSEGQLSLMQFASGGKNWRSRTHVNSDGVVPNWPNGYHRQAGADQATGMRASPVVRLSGAGGSVTATVADFWEKFPSGIEANGSSVDIHFFPSSPYGKQELQGGERVSKTFWLKCAEAIGPPDRLDRIHGPLVIVPTGGPLSLPDVSGHQSLPTINTDRPRSSVPDGPAPGPQSRDGHRTGNRAELQTIHNEPEWMTRGLVSQVARTSEVDYIEELLSGEFNFFWKREAVDEYGWRNFGDCWADHEEKYSDDTSPVISHYNNQYDLLHGMLQQFLLTSDLKWWSLARPLAEHIIDIDLYHTRDDRAVYNGGFFWHTAHYRDASTSTHRTCSRNMVGEKHAVQGGGPGNEHNYTSGLQLYYHLTGSGRAKEAVLMLADWVLAMDDGERSVLAPLSGVSTGKASATKEAGYHGLGRGVGNSINALIDAWLLTGSERYVVKCRELIFRSIHPHDDIESLQLLNAELRWSYPVALHALLRFVEIVGDVDSKTSSYAISSVMHYARWMASNERFFFDDIDQLEFPTETWVAQDLRKGTLLMAIASHLESSESKTIYKIGERHFDSAWRDLMGFESKHFTRPAAIVLQQLPIAWQSRWRFKNNFKHESSWRDRDINYPARQQFVTQKDDIRSKLRSPKGLVSLGMRAIVPYRWRHTLPETSLGRRYRKWSAKR